MRDRTRSPLLGRRFRTVGSAFTDRRRSSSGQSFVELVLVLPVLIVLAVAVGDFGRVYASGVAVEDAAREAADYAAFDDINSSHFTTSTDPLCLDPGTAPVPPICAKDPTRLEALRRACAAVSALPGYSEVAVTCADPTARCATASAAAPGANPFCQLALEATPAGGPWASTCGSDALQTDPWCGWIVHVTISLDFKTALNFPPLPSTVHLVRDSRYAISALPAGS